jgi:chemotaxis protein methyltransferase CheR
MSVPSVDHVATSPSVKPRKSFLKNSVLWSALRHIKYQLVLRFAKRENRVYTQFWRFPNQFRALVDRVIPQLRPGVIGPDTPPLEIVVFACCSGEEAFSLSYVLRKNFPGLGFRIRGFDIVEDVVARARTATFSRKEVFTGPFVTEEFVEGAFDLVEPDTFRVKQEIAAPIEFATGDMLDRRFIESLGKFDLVLAQNVLFHLPRDKARVAFGFLHDLMKPLSALFVNGMDTDMRISLTKRNGLEPLDYLVEEIHNDARVDRGSGWAGAYWGRKPFSRNSREWLRKHGTIYYRKS